eukprot:9237224-Ditylum_brightwellii.AAC.1
MDNQKHQCMLDNGDMNINEDDMLKLNLGGKIITVERDILTQIKGSMLEAMFSGRWEKQLQRDGDGCIFLDVNLICFQIIVDYLVEMKYSSKGIAPHPTFIEEDFDKILQQMMKYFGMKNNAELDACSLDLEENQLYEEEENQSTQ